MSTKLPLLYSMFGLAGTGGEGDPLCPLMTFVPILGYEQFWFPCRINGDGFCSNWIKLVSAHPQNRQIFKQKYYYYQQDFHWLWTLGRVSHIVAMSVCVSVCVFVCLCHCETPTFGCPGHFWSKDVLLNWPEITKFQLFHDLWHVPFWDFFILTSPYCQWWGS